MPARPGGIQPSPGDSRVPDLRRHGGLVLISILAVALTVTMVAYPDLAFASALKGLKIWWDVVFPALLPFFVAGQVLMALGVVSFMGVLMEPFMRPLFNVPGVGAFVVAMGLASGYPIGSVLTAKLRREGQLSRGEAERLMSFTNTADPLFMAGAVAVGMFGNAALGGIIMAAHYLGALGTGLVLRFYRANDRTPPPPATRHQGVLPRAFAEMVAARQRDGRPFGQVLGDAVRDSVQTLLLVGGFIIVFSVIIQILTRVGAVAWITSALAAVLGPLGLHGQAVGSLVSGFFEITIGSQAAAQAPVPLLERVMLASAIIAWSGLSVLGQVAAVTQGTGVSMLPYVVSRLVHAVLAAAITVLLWNPGAAVPALAAGGAAAPSAGLPDFWRMLAGSTVLLGCVAAACLVLTALAAWRARAAS
jgi:sporulation integral membrane protein YlbJ